jgi:nitroimidazol reductase NimA-like FMN-containing flavoprotein (pyridoxamine 5'-phosphate oxidase superfamily)
MRRPQTHLDARFSEPDATATEWARAAEHLAWADQLLLATQRADGPPHVTPLIGIWWDDALHVCTGPDEQKHRNLERDPRCTLVAATGRSTDGLDVVVEGTARRVLDEGVLAVLAEQWVEKYGEGWRFAVHDQAFAHADGGVAHVFAIAPARAFAFAKSPAGQTTYRFTPAHP